MGQKSPEGWIGQGWAMWTAGEGVLCWEPAIH